MTGGRRYPLARRGAPTRPLAGVLHLVSALRVRPASAGGTGGLLLPPTRHSGTGRGGTKRSEKPMAHKTERQGQGARGSAMSENLSEARMLDRLKVALQFIPRQRREIFLAVRLQAMPYDEIARMTGLKVESEVARALLQIDDHLRRCEILSSNPWWQRIWRR